MRILTLALLAADSDISALVLGAAASGPWVAHFAGTDAGGMTVPGSLDRDAIDRLS